MAGKPFEGWVVLELMGHRQRGGFAQEVEIAGGKLLRIDIPVSKDEVGNDVIVSEFYGSPAIYCMTPFTEDVARATVTPWMDPRPIAPMGFKPRTPIPTLGHSPDGPDEDFSGLQDDDNIGRVGEDFEQRPRNG